MRTIIGMGIGNFTTLGVEAYERMQKADNLILQTGSVPVAKELARRGVSFRTLDEFYERATDFHELDRLVCDFLREERDSTLCVMGSVFQNTLARAVLREMEAEVLPGLSFGEHALSLCAGRLSAGPARIFSGEEFREAGYNGDSPLVITEVDNPYKAADIALKLLEYHPAGQTAYLVRNEEVTALPLGELTGWTEWDYSVCLVLDKPDFMEKRTYTFDDLCHIIAILRGKNGCPWDREQTHASLRQHLLEESYEVIDAIDQADPFQMEEELGDVLLQVVLHSRIGEEFSEFTMDNITDTLCRKMIHRHPHIFASDHFTSAGQVLGNWEKIKRAEKGQQTYAQSMEDVPKSMSPLLRAAKIQKKAALVGFDWPNYRGAYEKVNEELAEVEAELQKGTDPEEECGDLLFAAVNLLRLLGINGDTALNRACGKFIQRFRAMEDICRIEGLDLAQLDLEEQEKRWIQAKIAENFCK